MPADPAFPPADAALLALAEAVRATGYRFTTVTPATQARVNARPEAAVARGLRDVFGWSRPFPEDLLPAGLFDLMRRAEVLAPAADGLWRSLVRLSTLQGALFLHSAHPTTAPDAVFFGPDTVRFADAIHQALAARQAPIRRAADIGCGAGPGGILVARAHPGAEVALLDINHAALRLARINAALAGTPGAVAMRSDLLAATTGAFDLIVSNPPYLLDPGRRAYRHGGGALGEGLSVAILDAALGRLAPGGTLVLYTGVAMVEGEDAFLAAAEGHLRGTRFAWDYREMDPDVFGEELEGGAYARADRIAAVVLTATDPRSP
ncbi:methyltransferase [Paracraurococcus ruber]|uniref:SAM-dependent methyltransferase n=1 Tax=Paracraurococcus ruber TaxID=77675 RepID=A0ABS1D1G3_9PROT|nr:class I SAM-dependent methyltransferase [Paracraurococcus ruber]MBK1660659.1 SAM-dependent methyltransferase [Paracraurococcus ruber]TDG18961.1 class I SAM-dependent methyltransferase [Paracraurococcus ruber]